MLKKQKFKPEIKQVKLNPEQAVLACTCFRTGVMLSGGPVQKTCLHYQNLCVGGKVMDGRSGCTTLWKAQIASS